MSMRKLTGVTRATGRASYRFRACEIGQVYLAEAGKDFTVATRFRQAAYSWARNHHLSAWTSMTAKGNVQFKFIER